MEPTAAELRLIRRKVARREARISAIFDFLSDVVSKYGVETKRSVHSCHTSVVTELNDVNGLSFKWSTGNTSMGGNDLQIYYAPDQRARCLVFNMYYWAGFKDCQIRDFSQDLDWQRAFDQVRRNPGKFFTEQRKKEERAKRLAERRKQEKEDRAKLLQRAQDLGIVLKAQ